MVFMLALDYRTFTDKSHLIYLGLLLPASLRRVLRRRADGSPPLDFNGPLNIQPSNFAKIGVALVLAKFFGENRGAPAGSTWRIAGRADRADPHPSHRERADLGTAVDVLVPVLIAVAFLAGTADAVGGARSVPALEMSRCVEVRAAGLSEEQDSHVS